MPPEYDHHDPVLAFQEVMKRREYAKLRTCEEFTNFMRYVAELERACDDLAAVAHHVVAKAERIQHSLSKHKTIRFRDAKTSRVTRKQ